MLRQHSSNNHYCLSFPKTTVGTKDCELVVEGANVSPQHFSIEKLVSGEFVLHDLGTSSGTFVNQCRVSGASVKLNCGDVIKVTQDGPSFTFITSSPVTSNIESINPTIIGPNRPNSAPIEKTDVIPLPSPRQSSAILTGRTTMRPNILNGVVHTVRSTSPLQQAAHLSQHQTPLSLQPQLPQPQTQLNLQPQIPTQQSQPQSSRQDTVLEFLHQTVQAQENKLMSLSEDVNMLRIAERQGQAHAQTINHLEKEIEELRKGNESRSFHKLQQQRSETNTANNIVATLQRELNHKTEKESSLEREIESLNKEKKDNAGAVVVLRRQLAEKDAELRQLKAEHNASKIRPDEMKEQNIIFAKENKNLRKQVRDGARRVQEEQDKVSHLEKDLGEIQKKLEHETRMHVTARDMVARNQTELAEYSKNAKLREIEAKEAQAQLKLFESSVREAISKLDDERESEEQGDLTKRVNELVRTYLSTKKTLSRREEELDTARTSNSILHDNLCKVEVETLGLVEIIQTGTHNISDKIHAEGDKIVNLDISDNLKWLQGLVVTLVRGLEKLATDLEIKTKFAEVAAQVTGLEAGADPSGIEKIIQGLRDTTLKLTAEKQVLEERLANTIDDYEHKLTEQNTKLTTQMATEMEDLKRLHAEQMQMMAETETDKRNDMLCEYSAELTNLKHRISEMEKEYVAKLEELNSKTRECDALSLQVDELLKSEKTSKMIEEGLRDQVSRFDEDTLAMRQENIALKEEATSLEDETAKLREQNKQYAVTIVAMENKLHSIGSRYTNMETEYEDAKLKLSAIPPPPPEPYHVMKDREENMEKEIQRLKTLANTLRREFGLAKAEADQRAVQIHGLKSDLMGAAARLSDMSGELSEKQKVELESMRDTILEQESSIKIHKDTIEVLRKDLKETREKLYNSVDHIPEKAPVKTVVQYKEKELSDQEKEFLEAGRKCLKERHSAVIDKQRSALADFRLQLKSKSSNIIGKDSNKESNTQQLSKLRKELNELRSQLKKQEGEFSVKETELRNKLNKSYEKREFKMKEIQMELDSSQKLFGHSEACFSSLVTEIREILSLSQAPIETLSIGRLDAALKDRALLTADLSSQIKALTDRLHHAGIQLANYKDQLYKKGNTVEDETEVEVLKSKISLLEEESRILRDSLTKLQSDLEPASQRPTSQSLEDILNQQARIIDEER